MVVGFPVLCMRSLAFYLAETYTILPVLSHKPAQKPDSEGEEETNARRNTSPRRK